MQARANSAAARDIASYLHPYTNLKAHQSEGPLIIERGDGVRVYDETGKEYIEAMGGLWCTSLGFSQERLADAAREAMLKLPFYHGFTGKSHPPGIDLAERLLALAPVPMSKVFFANSGSEAIDTAVKIVWYVNNARGLPQKKKIISRVRAYHGVTVAAASLTGIPTNHIDFDLPLARVLHADCPHFYRLGEPGETEEEFATRCADRLEELILREGPDTVAAFFAEPVMGAGGVIIPPATYFEKVQAVLKKYDIMLVADEVICGFWRTGKRFGCETYDIKPDMITIAKAMSSGYLPISALMISEEVYQALLIESDKVGAFAHGFTYGGHPVSCAVALETLNIYDEIDISNHVRNVSPKLQDGLRRLGEHPLVGDVRGVGLIGALELVADKETREPFPPTRMVGVHAAARAQEHGAIVRAMMGDALAFAPPLIIDEATIDDVLARVQKALNETLTLVEAEGLK
jgi:4-aminobutyrate--pyruvate transaminase